MTTRFSVAAIVVALVISALGAVSAASLGSTALGGSRNIPAVKADINYIAAPEY